MSAEHSVVGAVLIDNDAWWRVSWLRADEFADPELAKVWLAMDRLAGEGFPIDPVTLNEQDESLSLSSLTQLALNTPSTANVEAYAKVVRERSQDRRNRSVVASYLNGETDLSALMARLEATSHGSDMSLSEAVKLGVEAAEKAKDTGVPTGIPSLDRWMHLAGGKLVIVAARPSIGKTACVWQWLLHAGSRDIPTGLISLEMGPDELGIGALANRFGIDSLDLSRGRENAVAQAKGKTLDLPVRLDFRATSLNEIVSRITEWRHRYRIEMAAVDYLQLIDADGENRNAELGRITRTMKKLARRLEIPIVLLCQFNRALEKTGRKPMLVDLRDSGEIEQDADIVLALHSELSEKPRRQVEFGILKNRAGRVGWLTERIEFEGAHRKFMEVSPWGVAV